MGGQMGHMLRQERLKENISLNQSPLSSAVETLRLKFCP